MESSRRAVESYWRWRLIDSATSDEDKVTPVYKLEEICQLLRSSHPTIVKELSDFILKRLDHSSPIVKHKALRLIKYTIGKSNAEFKREMQRHAVAIRQLLHYKGELDPLKGDALNKAVRDTAQDVIFAVFSADDNNKPPSNPAASDLNRRIQGFGNTNFEVPLQDNKKSFLSEVVDIGSATIKQGLSALTQGHSSLIKNETGRGTYKNCNLRASFTEETERGDRYELVTYRNETQRTSGGAWNQDSTVSRVEMSIGDSDACYQENKVQTREDRLLETVVVSGGVRLQPTREAVQVFLTEAAKLDAMDLCHALERKLQSPMWQVRMKAVCVLESILRKKDDDHFSRMASYFSENNDVVLRCSESPQASLREKANKVLGLLGGDQLNSCAINSEKAVTMKTVAVAELPDLIDTGNLNDYDGNDDTTKSTNQNVANLTTSTPLGVADNLFGKNDNDPFSDVSFDFNENKEHADDLFSGMTVGDDNLGHNVSHGLGTRSGPESIDIFASNSRHGNNSEFVGDLLAGLSIYENTSSTKQKATSPAMQSESLFSGLNNHASNPAPDNDLGGMLGSQGFNVNPMFPSGHLPYTMQPGIMLNQPYSSKPLNYGSVGNLFAQQQFLATMANFQHFNNVNKKDGGTSATAGPNGRTPLPDIFQSNFPTQTPSSPTNSSMKEQTKAFDFISDHLAAAYDPRRVI
ncbi:protein MODIFIED TRANSPORT TO THE VACUOLE 1 [Abrus precatorius]|uniref:Protein MODIFIED TRANSPORT TO THE VACUOLE 1 n=1 Tax=Abrus precatorius TaxID=3816 RepID=A0A8B8KKQ1_ABRPR|nr:protein MODIFIED TRANSPORT TO THE VACUOLE 1 [Abrus precatorius]